VDSPFKGTTPARVFLVFFPVPFIYSPSLTPFPSPNFPSCPARRAAFSPLTSVEGKSRPDDLNRYDCDPNRDLSLCFPYSLLVPSFFPFSEIDHQIAVPAAGLFFFPPLINSFSCPIRPHFTCLSDVFKHCARKFSPPGLELEPYFLFGLFTPSPRSPLRPLNVLFPPPGSEWVFPDRPVFRHAFFSFPPL